MQFISTTIEKNKFTYMMRKKSLNSMMLVSYQYSFFSWRYDAKELNNRGLDLKNEKSIVILFQDAKVGGGRQY